MVYINQGKEIDFLTEKQGKKYFIQVALSAAEDKAYNREMRAFSGMNQLDKKLLITTDNIDYFSSNITHVALKKFLMSKSLEEL